MKRIGQSPLWVVAVSVAAVIFPPSIEAQLVLGGPSADGSLEVRRAIAADSLILEIDPDAGIVSIGNNTLASETNIDFTIADYNSGDLALWVDSSSALLSVGSVSNSDDGDIYVFDGNGALTMTMNGSSGKLTLGGSGEDGDLEIQGGSDDSNFEIDGTSGNATQALAGEGLIKAWCRVGSSGALLGGFRCSATTYEGGGQFFTADFTALATDISARGIMITVNDHGGGQNCTGEVVPADLSRIRISCTNQVQFIVAIF